MTGRLGLAYAEKLAKGRTAVFTYRHAASVLHLRMESIRHARAGLAVERAVTAKEIARSKVDLVAVTVDQLLDELREAERALDAQAQDPVS